MLAEGVAAVEAVLGLPLQGGGQHHPHVATHNRLIAQRKAACGCC